MREGKLHFEFEPVGEPATADAGDDSESRTA
jgi:hypothetical protein